MLRASALAAALWFTAGAASAVTPQLTPAVTSSLVFNGVSTTKDGRIFMTYPRQDKAGGLEVGEVKADAPSPYPDTAWNGWTPGRLGYNVFVRANALRIGPDGMLWVVDAGAPGTGQAQVVGGAKVVRIDPKTNTVKIVYPLGGAVKPGSYVDDIRFNGDLAYLTDAGTPGGLIVLDLRSGRVRRVLDGAASTTAQVAQTAEGRRLTDKDGRPVGFNADQLEVSPDGRWLYYQPATGPLYRIETRFLNDPKLDDSQLNGHVQLFARLGATGGTAMDAKGDLYASDLDRDAIVEVSPGGTVTTLVQDPRLVWVDALWIDDAGALWVPAAQLDRTAGMNGGRDAVNYPTVVYKLPLGLKPLRR